VPSLPPEKRSLSIGENVTALPDEEEWRILNLSENEAEEELENILELGQDASRKEHK
jgi:hypothetical protein